MKRAIITLITLFLFFCLILPANIVGAPQYPYTEDFEDDLLTNQATDYYAGELWFNTWTNDANCYVDNAEAVGDRSYKGAHTEEFFFNWTNREPHKVIGMRLLFGTVQHEHNQDFYIYNTTGDVVLQFGVGQATADRFYWRDYNGYTEYAAAWLDTGGFCYFNITVNDVDNYDIQLHEPGTGNYINQTGLAPYQIPSNTTFAYMYVDVGGLDSEAYDLWIDEFFIYETEYFTNVWVLNKVGNLEEHNHDDPIGFIVSQLFGSELGNYEIRNATGAVVQDGLLPNILNFIFFTPHYSHGTGTFQLWVKNYYGWWDSNNVEFLNFTVVGIDAPAGEWCEPKYNRLKVDEYLDVYLNGTAGNIYGIALMDGSDIAQSQIISKTQNGTKLIVNCFKMTEPGQYHLELYNSSFILALVTGESIAPLYVSPTVIYVTTADDWNKWTIELIPDKYEYHNNRDEIIFEFTKVGTPYLNGYYEICNATNTVLLSGTTSGTVTRNKLITQVSHGTGTFYVRVRDYFGNWSDHNAENESFIVVSEDEYVELLPEVESGIGIILGAAITVVFTLLPLLIKGAMKIEGNPPALAYGLTGSVGLVISVGLGFFADWILFFIVAVAAFVTVFMYFNKQGGG